MSIYKQGVGTFKAATVDYSPEVTSAMVIEETTTETIPAVLSTGEEEEVGGAKKRYLELSFLEQRDADGLWAECKAAYASATQELAIAYKTESGVISADNPEYQMTIRVTSISTGGKVGKIREKTFRWPVKAGSYVEDTTP
jgi:hypothetical protein